MSARSRNWCFTLNNYTEDDFTRLTTVNAQVRYIVVGREVGIEHNTSHLQGYIIFHNAKTMPQAKAFISDRAHIELPKGTFAENRAYCTKEGNATEIGEAPKEKGKRSDLEDIKKAINQDHKGIFEVIDMATSYQSIKMAEALFKYQKQPPPFKRTIKWYWGATGTGKTRSAVEESNGDFYITTDTLKWWDGYTGQKVVILDDLRPQSIEFHVLLRLLDRYPVRLQVKGASFWMPASSDTIIITSSLSPEQWQCGLEDREQLIRRLDEVKHFE